MRPLQRMPRPDRKGNMDWQYFLELFLGGLTRGSIYALIAIGYTMVYGIIELDQLRSRRGLHARSLSPA